MKRKTLVQSNNSRRLLSPEPGTMDQFPAVTGTSYPSGRETTRMITPAVAPTNVSTARSEMRA